MSFAAGYQYIQAIARASQVHAGAKKQKRKDIDEVIRRIVVHQAIVPQQHMREKEHEKGFRL